MPSRFTLETHIAATPSVVFNLARDIGVHVASMHASQERAVDGVTMGLMELGDTVTFRARHFGIWFTMTARVTEMSEPTRFTDQQARGPFRSFRHQHEFEATPWGGTLMTDTVELASPAFGVLAERLILVPYLRRLIASRNAHLAASLH
jgi:ligand-binding SRPBCC domain-containing protein